MKPTLSIVKKNENEILADPWLWNVIRCPFDLGTLTPSSRESLQCACGRSYEVRNGIPVLTMSGGKKGFWGKGLPEGWRGEIGKSDVDPFVQHVIGATGGYMYEDLRFKMTTYPIPQFPLSPGNGKLMLDIGSNWGRWCVAASREGFTVVGIEPHFEAVEAAYRVSKQLGVSAHFVVGDARYLPFAQNTFDLVFSYSVLQHFDPKDVEMTLSRANTILKPGGEVRVQMANGLGLRGLYHQARRGFRRARNFEVTYWTPWGLKGLYGKFFGKVGLEVDGFFSVNAQAADVKLLPWKYRTVVRVSALFKKISVLIPPMKIWADSLYVTGKK